MTRKELINKIAQDTKTTQKDVAAIVEAFLNAVKEIMVQGDQLSLMGFGTFGIKERSARKGINPLTKEPLDVPAKNVPYFKPSKILKEAVNR